MFGLLALYGISYRCGMGLSGVYEPLESRFHRLALTRFERFNRGFICHRQMRTDPGETKVTETQCRCWFDISISAVSKGSTSSDLCCFINIYNCLTRSLLGVRGIHVTAVVQTCPYMFILQ